MKLTEDLFIRGATKLLATFNRNPNENQIKSVFNTLKFYDITDVVFDKTIDRLALEYAQLPTWGTVKRECSTYAPEVRGCYKCENGIIRRFNFEKGGDFHEANCINKAKEIAGGKNFYTIADRFCDCEMGQYKKSLDLPTERF